MKNTIMLLTALSVTILMANASYAAEADLKSDQKNISAPDNKNMDTDGDGLSDYVEINQYYSDPLVADTDGDGLNDGFEIDIYRTSPVSADTDGDGHYDGAEVNFHRTNPVKKDLDWDHHMVTDGSDPCQPEDDIRPNTTVEKQLKEGRVEIIRNR